MNAGVAAGHPATADAGWEILEQGGTAADAAVAACLASCVAETVMTGLLGGGHAIYWDAATGEARDLDFFVTGPGLGPGVGGGGGGGACVSSLSRGGLTPGRGGPGGGPSGGGSRGFWAGGGGGGRDAGPRAAVPGRWLFLADRGADRGSAGSPPPHPPK